MADFVFEGRRVYYESHGAGRPLLLLNGIMMSCASWRAFVEPLSAQNRLLLVDFLDQGRSDRLEAPYGHAVQLRLVDALLDHLGLAGCVVAGISYGAEIALEYAILRPERVERLLLFNATAATGPWLRDIGRAWNLAAGGGESYYYTAIPVIYSPRFYTRRNDWMERRRQALVPLFRDEAFAAAMVRLTDSSEGYDVRDRLGEVACPTLVVACQQDYLTPVEEQRLLADRIRDSHYVLLPDCGHASMYEQPLLFASLILGFANAGKLTCEIG